MATLIISMTSIGIVGAATYYGKKTVSVSSYGNEENHAISFSEGAQEYIPTFFVSFPETVIDADGAYIGKVDLSSGTITPLYTKNEKQKLPIASISKLMTAYVALQGRSLNSTFIITDWAISGPWPSHKFTAGDVYSLRELLEATLVESNNDAARVLAASIGEKNFVQKMNLAAAAFALPDTKLYSSDGTERKIADTWVENTSTPEDIAHLIVSLHSVAPELLQVTTKPAVLISDVTGTKTFTAYSTNRLMEYFGNEFTLLGGKTGTSDSERRHLVILFEDAQGDAYVAVVLQSKDSFKDMATLLSSVREYTQSLYAKN